MTNETGIKGVEPLKYNHYQINTEDGAIGISTGQGTHCYVMYFTVDSEYTPVYKWWWRLVKIAWTTIHYSCCAIVWLLVFGILMGWL